MKKYISVEDLIEFYNSPELSVYTLIFKPKNKKSFIGLCILYILSTFSIIFSLYQSLYNTRYWNIILLVCGVIYILIGLRLSNLQKQIESKEKKSYKQMKLEKLQIYCQKFKKDDLEKILNILIRREPKELKKFTLIIPGAIVLLPLWSMFLTKLFNQLTDISSIIRLFLSFFISILFISLIFWRVSRIIFKSFINRRNDKINLTINAIEELLLNQYQ